MRIIFDGLFDPAYVGRVLRSAGIRPGAIGILPDDIMGERRLVLVEDSDGTKALKILRKNNIQARKEPPPQQAKRTIEYPAKFSKTD